VQRLEALIGDRLAGGAIGRLADGDGVRAAGGLEAGGNVDGIAHHRVAVADGAGHHLARVDSDPQREAGAVLGHHLQHREAGAHGPLRIVLVGDRRPEDAHHVVADELVDRPAEALDLLAEASQGAIDEGGDRLRIHPLGGGRVAGEVGEEHGRQPALLRRRGRCLRCRCRLRRVGCGGAEVAPALDAELGAGRVLGAACRAPRGQGGAAGHAEPSALRILSTALVTAPP
jgi:hypothetical protein